MRSVICCQLCSNWIVSYRKGLFCLLPGDHFSQSLWAHGLTGHIVTPDWSWKCNAIFLVAIGPMNQIEMLLNVNIQMRGRMIQIIFIMKKDRAFHLDFSQYQENLQEGTFSVWHNGPVCVPILIVWTTFSSVNMKIYFWCFFWMCHMAQLTVLNK